MAFDIPGITFLEKHEKLIIAIVVCATLLYGVSSGLNAWVRHDQTKVDKLQAQVESDKQQVAEAHQQVAQVQAAALADKAASAQEIAAMAAQNATLNANIIARDKATAGQQTVDMHATIPELSQRFASLVPGVDPKDIRIASDSQTVTVGTDTAQKTVAQLELVPQLQSDLKDTQQKVTNLSDEIASLQTYNSALEAEVRTEEKEIGLLEKQLADADKSCQAQVNLEKAKTRRAFLRGFKWGSIFGFIGGIFTGHSL